MNVNLLPATNHKHGVDVVDKGTFIAWTREIAEHKGEIGFTTNFSDAADIFKSRDIDTNALLIPADVDLLVIEAAQALGKEITTIKERQAIMKSNPKIVADAYDWVDDKILALGGQAREKDYRRLRARVVELYNLENPPPPKNYIEVWVRPTPDMGTSLMKVNLPIKTTVAKVYHLLEGVMETEARLRNPFGPRREVNEKGRVWRYELLRHDLKRVVDRKSTLLKTNDDYVMMVKLVIRGGPEAPIAFLTMETPVKTPTETSVEETNDDKAKIAAAAGGSKEDQESRDEFYTKEWDYPEPLDDDGNPYFAPIGEEDWDSVYKQYSEKHKGMMDF